MERVGLGLPDLLRADAEYSRTTQRSSGPVHGERAGTHMVLTWYSRCTHGVLTQALAEWSSVASIGVGSGGGGLRE